MEVVLSTRSVLCLILLLCSSSALINWSWLSISSFVGVALNANGGSTLIPSRFRDSNWDEIGNSIGSKVDVVAFVFRCFSDFFSTFGLGFSTQTNLFYCGNSLTCSCGSSIILVKALAKVSGGIVGQDSSLTSSLNKGSFICGDGMDTLYFLGAERVEGRLLWGLE